MSDSLRSLLGDLTGRQRLFAITLLIVVVTMLVTLWTSGYGAAVVVGIALAGLLFLTRNVWLPENYGHTRVRLASLALVTAAAGSLGLWKPVLGEPLARLLEPYVPSGVTEVISALAEPSDFIVGLFLGFALLVVFIVNYFARDATVMGEAAASRDPDFPERDYRQKAVGFCRALEAYHHNLDLETHWSPARFVPLDAEVEVSRSRRLTPQITNLLDAIRNDRRSRLFLIVGDPGSGKSVALRRLAVDLLREFGQTGKIPLYVNLKEWRQPSGAEPSVASFLDFVRMSVRQHCDVFGQEFLDHYFKRLLEHGRLFLIIDSFDEMPQVMDSRESSSTIASLSAMLALAFSGATETRGVVASRVFRRPTFAGPLCRTLEIRPFSDRKIAMALKNSFRIGERTIRDLFRSRSDLVSAARNPFCAELLRVYLEENDQKLPSHQAELFTYYIERQLTRSADIIRQAGLSEQQVLDACTDIAFTMYSTSAAGLDSPLSTLSSRAGVEIGALSDVLVRARLARIGRSDDRPFSFVHRRFHEYFVARRFSENPALFPFEGIPEDSRWRDALVMYCESTSHLAAADIANRCWTEIRRMRELGRPRPDDLRLRTVHCLRFLRDAFGSRRECVKPFANELAIHICEEVNNGDLLEAKLALEGVGVLDEDGIAAALSAGFSRGNDWLNDTALRSCRHLAAADPELEQAVHGAIAKRSFWQFWRERQDLLFSFELSDAFRVIHTYCWIRSRWTVLMLPALALVVALMPVSLVVVALFFAGVYSMVGVKLRARVTLAAAALFPVSYLLAQGQSPFGSGDPTALSVLRLDPWGPETANFTAAVCGLSGVISVVRWAETWYRLRRLQPLRGAWSALTTGVLLMAGIALGALVVFIVLVASVFALGRIGLSPTASGGVTAAMFTAAVAIFWITKGVRVGLRRWRDRGRLSDAKNGPVGSRVDVAGRFHSFESEAYRLRYVEHLDEIGFPPSGDWPDGRLPDRECRASTALARLEEQWRGLSR